MPLFLYYKRNGVVQKTPALLKIIILFCVSIVATIFSVKVNLLLFCVCVFLVLITKISILEFFTDLKYILFYSLFILILDVLSYLLDNKTLMGIGVSNLNTTLIVRLITVFAYTSLFFRTTSVFDIRLAIEDIEVFITRGKTKRIFSKCFALFFSFIPRLFFLWNEIDKAYTSRMGKKGIRKIVRLIPIFIAVSIKRADTTVLSLLNREIEEK